MERILLVHDTQLDRLISGISAKEQKELNRLLGAWRRHLEKIIAGSIS